MSGIIAAIIGAGLGLGYFGGLWLTVRRSLVRPCGAVLMPASGLARLAALGMGLAALGRGGAGSLVAALGGIWVARGLLILVIGRPRRG